MQTYSKKKMSPLFALGIVLAFSSPTLLTADEPDDSKAAAKLAQDNSANLAAIDAMVTQLEHAQLTKREEARRNLMKAGKSAIPALAKAALSGKKEMIEKSIDILAKLSQTSDEDTKEAAKVTLQMLSESDQPSTAERAKLVLKSKQADGIQPFNGNNFNMPFGRGQGRSVSVGNINGRRSVTVKEGGKETSIEELANGKLHVVIRGGKEPVELLAKDLEELKKKSPDAFSVFEQYLGVGKGENSKDFPNGGALGNAAFQQFGGVGGAVDANSMLLKNLAELRDRMAGDPVMQQMIEQQIRMLDRNRPVEK